MPIQLKLRDDLEEAMAAYKHYDVLIVNAMFDGMNLVAKEGPIVNERDGVSILSENTGAHEELGEFALSVNPFDIQELADMIHRALTMCASASASACDGLREIVTAATRATGSTTSSPTSARRPGWPPSPTRPSRRRPHGKRYASRGRRGRGRIRGTGRARGAARGGWSVGGWLAAGGGPA